ncbi:DUF2855 family protein [Glaciecola petra]|uniref:DUF2855 family protein n=1 Tax=Glaciecola petra TaxID=3075602 RepID=A0ABU2ZV04_9ALTE|nr:DUF2855 family protein [Aestuariibacter sp. P117]MDT0596477.1 DUF2855 family protein [Aestuariibacter sp. P117]
MKITEIWVNKKNFRETKVVCKDAPQLDEGCIRVRIDKFALTSNNVSYAVSGELFKYWQFYPTGMDEKWGNVTVWGMADVIESSHNDISVGERINGFFPMASHTDLQIGKAKDQFLIDTSEHRLSLPPLYNNYPRCQSEPEMMKMLEIERCVLFPLYMTGYVLADFAQCNDYFEAEQIIVGSVSSKTGYSTAAFLRENGYKGKVVGLTSPRNIEFVRSLEVCDELITYADVEQIQKIPSLYLDMSGNKGVISALHNHLKNDIKSSQLVGATHWDSTQFEYKLPGPKPELYFTPTHAEKRAKELGAAVFIQQNFMASAQLSIKLKSLLKNEFHRGTEQAISIWEGLLDNKVDGQRGIMISLNED